MQDVYEHKVTIEVDLVDGLKRMGCFTEEQITELADLGSSAEKIHNVEFAKNFFRDERRRNLRESDPYTFVPIKYGIKAKVDPDNPYWKKLKERPLLSKGMTELQKAAWLIDKGNTEMATKPYLALKERQSAHIVKEFDERYSEPNKYPVKPRARLK